MKEKARHQLPDDHRALLAALGRFFRGHAETAAGAAQQLNAGPAAFLLYALFLRVLQLGRAVQELCVDGYGLEAQAIGRAMVSATLSMLLLAEADSDSRALLFAQFQRRLRRQRAKALVKHGHLTQVGADELEAHQFAEESAALNAQARAGTRPAKRLGDSRHGWSGLTDYGLANRFNKPAWYELFYGPMSDQSHVNAAAIGGEISSLLRGDVTIGGRFDSPFLVVLAAFETVSHASEVIDRYFSLGASAARQELDDAMLKELGVFARVQRTENRPNRESSISCRIHISSRRRQLSGTVSIP